MHFKRPSGTSRGVLATKDTWFLILSEGNKIGFGECAMFRGLSYDDRPDYEQKLQELCRRLGNEEEILADDLRNYPSLQFGLEQARLSLAGASPFDLYPSDFSRGEAGIQINGLIWMGNKKYVKQQIQNKIKKGFRYIKLKIGALDFETELELLSEIRKEFSADIVELRVDANGAFKPFEALEKLEKLSEYALHSIEQPIAARNYELTASLCEQSPIPIALDEELIGLNSKAEKSSLLQKIKPAYLILKPALIGGFSGTLEWIKLAQQHNIKWWITSALESNIGLNSLAQFTYNLKTNMVQGLGTGELFTNNIKSPLQINADVLSLNLQKKWNINFIKKHVHSSGI